MEFPFVRSWGDDDYERQLAGLLADVRRRPYVLTPVATALLLLPENFRLSYFLIGRPYCARESHFEATVCKRQQSFAG